MRGAIQRRRYSKEEKAAAINRFLVDGDPWRQFRLQQGFQEAHFIHGSDLFRIKRLYQTLLSKISDC